MTVDAGGPFVPEEWFRTIKPLADGIYWHKRAEHHEADIVGVRNGCVQAIGSEQWDTVFRGWWAGPLEPPA